MSRLCPCQQKLQKKEDEEQRIRAIRERQTKIFKDSMLSQKFLSSSFKSWNRSLDTESMYQEAYAFANEWEKRKTNGDGLILCGNPGCGKTHLLSAITNTLLGQGVGVIFVNVPELLKKIRSTFQKDSYGRPAVGYTESDIYNKLQNAELLVLDDVGAERCSGWTEEFIYTLVNGLYVNKKPLLVSTNLKLEEIINQVGERTFDRMIEMCRIVECTAPSYRAKMAITRRKKEVAYA